MRETSESWADGGRQAVRVAAVVETAATGRCRLSRLCPVGQACAVPCVQPCDGASVFPWSGLLAVGAGSRGWAAGAERDETRRDEGRVDGALEGRGTRHEAQGAKG